MSCLKLAVAFLLLIGVAWCNLQDEEFVSVEYYYESMCPDCTVFMNTSLRNAIEKLGDQIDVYFYPYGNAIMKYTSLSGKLEVTCQHGEDECYLNSAEICVLSIIDDDPYQLMDYSNCLVTSDSDDVKAAAYECLKSTEVSEADFDECMEDEISLDILTFGKGYRTDKTGRTGVPWILVNDDNYEGEDDKDDFLQFICDKFQNKVTEIAKLNFT